MKKVLALVLAVVLAFGMASVGFALTPNYAGGTVGVGTGGTTYGLSTTEFERTISDYQYYQGLKVQPNQELKINLWVSPAVFDMVNTADGLAPEQSPMTVSNLTTAKYDITYKKTKGYPCVDTIKLVNKKIAVLFPDTNAASGYSKQSVNHVFVEIKFIKEMVSVKDEDFEYDVTFTYKKSKIEGSLFTVYGNMENPITELDEDNDTVDLKDGTVAHAQDFIKDVEIDAGNGITVKMNLFEDCKYYCKASMELSKTDAEIMDKTVAIEGIVTMKTATSKNATFRSGKVTMELSDKYYVYDADGKYIGTSTDTLPFSSKYYLATSKIDMGSTATEVPSTEPSAPVDPSNPSTGGDSAPANANDNPGTGR